jgi:hypothetical protein
MTTFFITLVRSWSIELEEANVYGGILPEEGLNCSRARQA